MNKVEVVAKEGTWCPRENDPRRYITDSAPVAITLTPYYRACLRDGSLRDAVAGAKTGSEVIKKTKKKAVIKGHKKEVRK